MSKQADGNDATLRLTRQQARAMLAFLWSAGREGFDTHASDMAVWDWGIRPWPTMDNLAAKGLIEAESWGGREEGWTWRLTPDGMDYMRKVAAERGR